MAKIEVGDTFGKLVVLSKSETKRSSCIDWVCKCTCGTVFPVKSTYLRRGETTHCGCSPRVKQPKDITGIRKGKLVAIESTGVKSTNGDYMWMFKCECGNITKTSIGSFNSGKTRSCGCLALESAKNKESTHGMEGTQTYNSWRKMRERCSDPKNNMYKNYGGKGVGFCKEWDNFKVFHLDMGTSPEDHTIDRIDNSKDYSPSNCRWVNKYIQSRNRGSNTGSSQYKGVQNEKSSDKWLAVFSVGSIRCKKIGRFHSEHEAAQAYNLASELVFGEGNSILTLNVLPDDYKPVVFNNRFFTYWVPKMKEEADKKYKLNKGGSQ